MAGEDVYLGMLPEKTPGGRWRIDIPIFQQQNGYNKLRATGRSARSDVWCAPAHISSGSGPVHSRFGLRPSG
jgi:hypothetical protein